MFSQIFGYALTEAQNEEELDEEGNPIGGAEEGLSENPDEDTTTKP